MKLNWEWDWQGALDEFQKAIALNPSHEAAHRWLSAYLGGIGRDDEALPIALRAVELDPMSVLPRMNLGIVHLLAWRHEVAELELRRVIEKDPGFVRAYAFLACSLSFQNRHDEAIAAGRIGAERSNQHPMLQFALGVCMARAGQHAEAREIFEPIFSELSHFYQATVHAVLGEESAALDKLEATPEDRSDWMYSVPRQYWFRELHSHPRFIRLVENLGLSRVAGVVDPIDSQLSGEQSAAHHQRT